MPSSQLMSPLPQAPAPVFTPQRQPQEEVCVECAMRDEDLADVDVTSPGVWERESDVLYEELQRREHEDEAAGIVPDDPTRPKSTGGLLSEQNLKVWLSVNPREPASRQQTLSNYIKSQRTLLEAEALARARAMQEAKQLDNRMRDTYSQLRRSAFDTGNSATPAGDDSGGVRIKPPRSPSSPQHPTRSHSREITLLENGMIVEHVDVRKEEKEARERRRREEKRARKSSRNSVVDVNSIISAQSFPPPTDSGLGAKPYSRYSQASSARPMSVLTAPLDRGDRTDLPRAYSQASFSDIHSLGSASPRRTRFFGMKNLSTGWRSQDSLAPSGISGSMMDMHVALQNESYGQRVMSPVDTNAARQSQLWPPKEAPEIQEDKAKKKKKGLAKIWGKFTGSSKQRDTNGRETPQSYERTEDDLPLAPPPPLSYLVNRGRAGERHASTPSLPSTTSPKIAFSSPGMSPPTAPSSVLPSPGSSSRMSGADPDTTEPRKSNGTTYDDDQQQHPSEDTIGKSQTRNVHSVISEPDMRRASQSPPPRPPLPRPDSMLSSREKSLPPLPMEAFAWVPEARPRTMMSFDPRPPPGSGPAHDFLPPQAPFRSADTRRQSFNGLSSRPNVGAQTTPVTQPVQFDQRRPFGGPRYDEFGLSRRSLGRLEHVQEHPPVRSSPAPATKRRSRFGLSSLLGKRSASQNLPEPTTAHTFPAMRRSGSEGQEDMVNGYATSTSRHSAFSQGGPRMSVTSRKALEDLVAQDPDFVAYRYPSNDQHLDILR
ncbi:hypothetical protein C8J57DRAFT_589370 [Mycena rebaudengoi]|nr:hypothetical protein C8J57DRAFT_589370 [Mycena rebaudengoi]